MKKIIAVLMCVVMILMTLASCSKKEDKGAVINMYLPQEVYDFDPVYAYKNDSALQLVDLMFSSLFAIDEKGKVTNELASDWVVDKEKNMVTITISDDAYWSDGVYVTADDFVYTVKRILNPEFTTDLASLLFCIKNARAVKNATADLYVDDIGVDAVSEKEVAITFEDGFSDYDGFKRTLASPALAPLREQIVKNNEGDWAKKPGTMYCSGPFMLRKVSYASTNKGLILERNPYYFREKDQKVDKSVTPYRIVVDYTKSAEEQYEMYKNGQLFYVGNIAISLRGSDIKNLVVKDSLSTATIYLNQNACLGEQIRKLDYEYTPKRPSEPNSEKDNIEYDDNGLVVMTMTYKNYYTYFNHMLPEDYAKKYNGAKYQYHEAYDNTPQYVEDHYVLSSSTVERITMEYGDEMRTVDVYYEDYAYVIRDDTPEKNIISYTYDIDDGVYLLAIDEIRHALSLAIDREAIANAVVYASAASALVPNGIYNTDSRKQTFRNNGSGYISTTANMDKARELIAIAEEREGIDISDYCFEFAVRKEDEVHSYIGDVVSAAWKELGFNVEYVQVVPYVNNEKGSTGEVAKDIRDDIINEKLYSREFHATLVDLVAPDVTAMSVLAPFATEFAGTAIDMLAKDENGVNLYKIEGHITGYNSEEYNSLIEQAYATGDLNKKAELLHKAEEILMRDLPVIPIIYNKEAYVVSKQLSKVQGTYIGTRVFTKTKLKNYKDYLPEDPTY